MKKPTDTQKNHVLKWKQSGLSMRQYCSDHRISYWSFREWKKRETQNSGRKNGLVRIPSTLYNQQRDHEPIEIILKNGIRVIVNENSGSDQLKNIVWILDSLS